MFLGILPQVYTPRENVRRFEKVVDESLLVDWSVYAQEPEQLEGASDIVAVVKVVQQQDRGVPLPVGNYLQTICTVETVISGNAETGDELRIYEPCNYYKNEILHSFSGYYPMNIGESYLVFLRVINDKESKLYGGYHVVDNIHGKYPLDAETGLFCRWYLNMAEELEIADMDTIPTYIARYQLWYEQVRAMYPEVFA